MKPKTKYLSTFARYCAKREPEYPTCGHNKGAFRCLSLKSEDTIFFHSTFYSTNKKQIQDAFILKYTAPVDVTRWRPKDGSKQRRQFQVKCYVGTKKNKLIPVCQRSFLLILQITRTRLHTVVHRYFETKEMPRERRGGDRKSGMNLANVNAIISFLNTLKCSDLHNCVSKTGPKRYLPPELNVKKLYKMFLSKNEGQKFGKEWLFRSVVTQKFCASFRTPQTDLCFTCYQLKRRIKLAESNEKKLKFMVEKRVHILKTKAFFSLLKETREDLFTLSFDCQKNHPLPKLPGESAYYSHHFSMYNLTIVQGSSRNKISPTNVFTYCWSQEKFQKDSNLIASVLYHRLLTITFDELVTIKTVRIIANICGDKYRNSILVAMCSAWLMSNAPAHIEQIELIFPVIGHTFLPPNNVFTKIDKWVNKSKIILDPEKYIAIYNKMGSIVRVDEDCYVFDWKQEVETYFEGTWLWNFSLEKVKRFYLKRTSSNIDVLVRGECHYKNDKGTYKKVTKKNVNVCMMNPNIIQPNEVHIKESKLKNINDLLVNYFGENWRSKSELLYYSSIIPLVKINSKAEEEDEVTCVFHEEVENILV